MPKKPKADATPRLQLTLPADQRVIYPECQDLLVKNLTGMSDGYTVTIEHPEAPITGDKNRVEAMTYALDFTSVFTRSKWKIKQKITNDNKLLRPGVHVIAAPEDLVAERIMRFFWTWDVAIFARFRGVIGTPKKNVTVAIGEWRLTPS